MKSFTVSPDLSGKKVVRASLLAFPGLSAPTLHKALRSRDIRLNGRRITTDVALAEGDIVELWLPDASFEDTQPAATGGYDDYRIVFETDQLLLVNKRPGLAVHPGKGESGNTLIEIIRRDQHNSGMDLCHRIDMNTGGLLLLAKNKDSLEQAIRLFHEDRITKRYRCLVRGVPETGTPCVCTDDALMKELSAWLEKPARGNVFIHDEPGPDDLPITTRYRVLRVFKKAGPDGESVSELEVELVTGRTHQIRAHLAHLGHPILGDGNYGRNSYNRFFKAESGGFLKRQQLFASSLIFSKIPRDNVHYGLSGRTFSIEPMYDIVPE
ncbi:MAG: RluA family pseudouridine synthase [Oscillospiraceae bacterium]|nr:RluA family pseudouridine synthase [Oscillospiraceae bacterium]